MDADWADLMFFYCLDSATSFRWIGLATHSSFCALLAEVRSEPETWQEHTDDLDSLLSASIHERETLQGSDGFTAADLVPTEMSVMQSLACMAAASDLCDASGVTHPGCHFIVVRHAGTLKSNFRTFLMPRDALEHPGPLSEDEFSVVAEAIVAEDRKNHPDWFE
ncbi:hypothetical protein KW835_12750 [Acidovorax sp. sic0104]|nr:hypothetical protein [Acidovorax sp. sic0104]